MSVGTTISALAWARSPTRCEPGPPTGETVTLSSPASQLAAEVLRAAGRRRDGVGERGLDGGPRVRQAAHHPAQRRQHEHLEGDERGDRVARQREDRGLVLAHHTETLGLARLHGNPAEPHGAGGGQRLLDHVVVAHRHPAGGDHHVGAHELVAERVEEGLRLVGHDADAVGDRARVADGRGEHVGVAVVDRVVAAGGAGLAQLRARGQDHHARPGPHGHRRAADAGQQAELARAEERALLDEEVALGDVLAGHAHVLAGPGRPRDDHLGDAAVGPLVGHDGVRARGHGRAGHDLHGRAGRHRADAGLAGADLPHDRQVHRTLVGGGRDVVAHHGVPVHGGVVEARQRDRRGDVLRHDQPQRVEQRLLVRRQRTQRVEDLLLVLGDGPQRRLGIGHQPSSTVSAATRCAESASSSTSPMTWTPRPNVKSPSTLSEVALRSDGAPSGKRWSKSPTSW